MDTNPVLAAALAYASRGWHVLPLHGKVPITDHGVYDATTDPVLIGRFFDRKKPPSVGIACGDVGNLWVLDADGEEGLRSLKTLGLDKGLPYVWTGGGGVHVYFAWSKGVGQRVRFLPGLDTRSEGGYVCAPPSVHESGKAYRWGGIERMPTGILDEAPASLLALVRKPDGPPRAHLPPIACAGLTNYGKAALDRSYEELSAVGTGMRDDLRNKIAWSLGRLVCGGHLVREDAISCLTAACEKNGLTADLGEGEIRKRAERGVDAGYCAGPRGPVPNPIKVTA